jgi:hypothetical protein
MKALRSLSLAVVTAALAFLPLRAPAQESLVSAEEHPAGGRLEIHEINSSILNSARRVAVYLPQGYDSSQRSYPLVLLFFGHNQWLSFLEQFKDAPATMESLVDQGRIQPLILAMPYVPRNVSLRANPNELSYLATELMPFLGAHFRTFADRGITGISGHFFGAVESFYAALRYPDVFRLAGGYEMCWFGWNLPGEVFPLLRAHRQEQTPLTFWVASEKTGAQGNNCASSQPIADLLDSLAIPHVYLDDAVYSSPNVDAYWLADNLIYFSAHLQEAIGEGAPHVLGGTDISGVAGQTTEVEVVLDAPLVAPASSLTLDATALGGPRLPLHHAGNGHYTGRLRLPQQHGIYRLPLLRETGADTPAYFAALRLSVYPASDLVILDEDVSPGWSVGRIDRNRVHEVTMNAGDLAFTGRLAAKVHGKKSFAGWSVPLVADDTLSVFGYSALRFAFAPGEADLAATDRFSVGLGNTGVSLRERVDFTRREWQVVEIPLEAFEILPPPFGGEVATLSFFGNFEGVFYVDDLRLVAPKLAATPTAVLEEQSDSRPQAFALQQNYPNPFNSGTIIRFALPSSEEVELVVYNIAGQKVATLVEGVRHAGSYSINWDGRDGGGRTLASGAYLYRLRAGGQMETRKLLLLR